MSCPCAQCMIDQLEQQVSFEVDGQEKIAALVDHFGLPYYLSRAVELLCTNEPQDLEEAILFIQLEMDKE